MDLVWEGVKEFERAVTRMTAAANSGTRLAVAEAAHRVEAAAKEHAPVDTGMLRRSIRVEGPRPLGPLTWAAEVGPTVVYGRRIELGFHDADSLGRHYDQEGQPYLEPGLDEVVPMLETIYAENWAKALRA